DLGKGVHQRSHMSSVSRLSNEKKFDTAVLRMELKRGHAAAGLTRDRLRRQFAEKEDKHDETAEELAEIDMSDEGSNAYSIKQLANSLVQDVLDDEDLLEDGTDADAMDDNSLMALKPPTESNKRPKRVRLFLGTQYPILLQYFFNYDAPDLEGQGLNIFKNAGLGNLQKELEAYDLLTRDMQMPVATDGSYD
ncbi:hypothetical protein FRC11_005871, partial [Ceratobasidium sp. 423]